MVDMKNTSNPHDEKVLNNLVKFFKDFDQHFDNETIDKIVNQEFPQKYALLPLLVKAQLYYNNH